jgi:serine/threonine protein kinase
VVSWIKQVCDALEYLHSQSPPIIHRDIKPQNVIVTAAGRAMLVDFGIAKIYDPSQATTVGARGYTPGYSPLEQYTHDPTDARSDVYALGATLYVLLTNSKPPPEAIQRKIKKIPVVPPSQLNSELNWEAEKVILRSLEIENQERYQTVTEFYNALEKTLVVDEKTVKTPPVRIRSGPPRWLLLGGAALLVILVVGSILLLTGIGLGSTSNAPAILAIEQAVIKIDGQTINVDDFQAVTCDTSPRLEIKFLDANGQQIEPTLFSYNWHFEPGDQNNMDKTNSSNYATIYNVPCELDNQTVIVEAQKDGKTFFAKSLLFDITE